MTTQNRFWRLRSFEDNSERAEWVDEKMDIEGIVCPANEGHQRGGKRLTDLTVDLPARCPNDVIWTWYNECLLTDRVLKLFQESKFSGFQVKRATAVTNNKRFSPLWELVVTGWAGVAPLESGINLNEYCEVCGHKSYTAWTQPDKIIDSAQWDGSDFFMVWPLPKYIFVTKRVQQAITEWKLSEVSLQPVEKMVWPEIVIPVLSPGRLSNWMPEERAKKLGIPLGIY